VESNSVSNHTSDYQNRTTAKRESDLLITSMITDWIGRHDVLLIRTMTKFEKRTNHRLIAERLNVVMNAEKHSSLLNKVHRKSARKMTRAVQLQAWRVHCPIIAKIGLLIANHVRELCYSFDYNNNSNNNHHHHHHHHRRTHSKLEGI